MAVERVKDFFKDTDVNVIELPESSATVALAAQALNTEPDQIAKTLSFLVDDAPILVVMAGKPGLTTTSTRPPSTRRPR